VPQDWPPPTHLAEHDLDDHDADAHRREGEPAAERAERFDLGLGANALADDLALRGLVLLALSLGLAELDE